MKITKNCANCGCEFTYFTKHGGWNKYCQSCKLIYKNFLKSKRVCLKHYTISTCLNCGVSFSQEIKKGPIAKYCSRSCARKYDNKRDLAIPTNRVCVYCEKVFVSKGHRKYCSDICRNKANYKHEIKEPNSKRCVVCNNQFLSARASNKYCSIRCQKKYYRSTEKYKELNRIQCRKKRANRLNTFWEYSDAEWRETLMYFDNKCAYCGAGGNLTQDHITPVTKGGETTIQNIVPACRKCNSKKNNRYIYEFVRESYDLNTASQIIRNIGYWYSTVAPTIKLQMLNML